MKDYN